MGALSAGSSSVGGHIPGNRIPLYKTGKLSPVIINWRFRTELPIVVVAKQRCDIITSIPSRETLQKLWILMCGISMYIDKISFYLRYFIIAIYIYKGLLRLLLYFDNLKVVH